MAIKITDTLETTDTETGETSKSLILDITDATDDEITALLESYRCAYDACDESCPCLTKRAAPIPRIASLEL